MHIETYTMKLMPNANIRTRLTIWFLLIIFLPLLFVMVLTYYQRAQVIEERTFDKLIAIRDLKVERLNDWLAERLGDIHIMSTANEIRRLEYVIQHSDETSEKQLMIVREHLQRFEQTYESYCDFFVINPVSGQIITSTIPEMVGVDWSGHHFTTEVLQSKDVFIQDIFYSKMINDYTMAYASPVFGIENPEKIVGVLVAMVDLQKTLYKMLLDRVGLGETGETLIVNSNVVALNQLRWYEDAPLNLKISAQPALEAARGNTGITITEDYRNEEVLAAYTYIKLTGWGFVCKQDMKELNQPIRDMMWNFMLVFIVTGVVISILTLRFSKTLSRPIVEMDRVARKMSKGDFSIRNTIRTNDELGSLAREFNTMAEVVDSTLFINKSMGQISEVMMNQTTMVEFGEAILKRLMDISEAEKATFYILNEVTMAFEHFTSIGVDEEDLKPYPLTKESGEKNQLPESGFEQNLQSMPENSIFRFQSTQFGDASQEIISIPIHVDGTLVARISLIRPEPFSSKTMSILQQSLSNIHTAYSNLLSNERTRILAEHLSKTNQQLEAQSEELQDLTEELQDQAEELMRTTDELHEQNIELEVQRKQVETANQLKSEFLSNMSHELRTPLNSVMALSRVLIMQAREKLDEEENSYLEIIERNGKRLLNLINDILDLSKIEAGKMEILTNTVSLPSTLQMIKDNMQSLADEKGLTLSITFEEGLPVVETDEERLFQVLLNIVSNAVKFTEKGGIDIQVKQVSQHIVVDVKDTGIGISEEMLPHVFDEFRQADGTSARQYEGTGLGLAIANKITGILGGNISVSSTLGKGSTFSITIPIVWEQQTQGSDSGGIGGHTILSSYPTPDSKTKSMLSEHRGKNILVVEDNPDAIIQLQTVLEKEGFSVHLALGGKEAMQYMEHQIPDGIILDLMMPGIDGFRVLELLRARKESHHTPVLILTAKDLTKEDLSRLSTNNIHQVVQKGDIDIQGLLNEVHTMLGQKSDDTDTLAVQMEQQAPQDSQQLSLQAAQDEPQLLIIENNPDNLITIKAILKDKYKIIDAYDGNAGLRLVYNSKPKLILLDMSLPKLDGESIVKILKADKETNSIPIIAVTAQAMKGDKEKFLAVGCDGYVSKPIDQKILEEEIERLWV